MFTKTKFCIAGIFSACALACVGFSAWTLGVPGLPLSVHTQGNASAYNVIHSNSYVELDSATPPQPLRIGKGGFSGGSPYSASMELKFNVHVPQCLAMFGKQGGGASFKVSVTLNFANPPQNNMFAQRGMVTASVRASELPVTATMSSQAADYSAAGYTATVQVSIADNPARDTASFTLGYSFNLGDKTNFDNYIYSVFFGPDGKVDQDVNFMVGVTVRGS